MSDDKKPPRRMMQGDPYHLGIRHRFEHDYGDDCSADASVHRKECQPVPESPGDLICRMFRNAVLAMPSSLVGKNETEIWEAGFIAGREDERNQHRCGSPAYDEHAERMAVLLSPEEYVRRTYGAPQEPPVTQDDEPVTIAARDESLVATNADAAPVAGVRAAPQAECGCETRGPYTFLCPYHQGYADAASDKNSEVHESTYPANDLASRNSRLMGQVTELQTRVARLEAENTELRGDKREIDVCQHEYSTADGKTICGHTWAHHTANWSHAFKAKPR